MVYGNGLENRRGETHREFESLPLRQVVHIRTPDKLTFAGGFLCYNQAINEKEILLY